MSGEKTYQGSCFCGAVEFTVTGEPAAMGFCHCESCRHRPAVHVNYQEATLPIKDGLPKLRDFPAEMGGSGEVLP